MEFAANQVALEQIGWRACDALDALDWQSGERLARVSAMHRTGLECDDGEQSRLVHVPMRFRKPSTPLAQRPAVGDWVMMVESSNGQMQLARILPRRTQLVRAAAGDAHKPQLIAANVDVVIIVSGLDHDFNPRRMERYLVLVQASGAQAVLALTKRDLSPPDDPRLQETRRLAGATVPVLALNARAADEVIRELMPFLGPGQTAVLVGSSGAGKSTLTNALLGRDKQKTFEVREHDSRGRHTTTARHLFQLPSGACLIDTPGMRELKLWGEEQIDAAQFDDIVELGLQCRFRDCAHDREPGCAVQAAIESGVLDFERFASYQKLGTEQRHAKSQLVIQQRKAEEKTIHRALNKRLTEKYGRR